MEKILVAILHGIGDSLMAMPAIHELKKKYPESSITVMTIKNPIFQDIFRYNKDVDEVIFSSLDYNPKYGNPMFWIGDYWKIKRDIRRAVKAYGFTKSFFVKMILMPAKIYANIKLPRYMEHKTFKVARELGVELKDNRYYIKYGDDDRRWAELFLKERNIDEDILIGLHVSGSSVKKSLPAETTSMLVKVLNSFGYQVLLFHSKQSYERDKNKIPEGVKVCVSDNLLHTAALVDKCSHMICVDSGVGHIAAALNKRLLSVFMREIWISNSLAIGDCVKPYLYQRDDNDLLEVVRTFLKTS